MLEILSADAGPTPVSEILAETALEASLLSQHLAVLKRHGVVRHQREGNAVHYELAHPTVAELLSDRPHLPRRVPGRATDQLKARGAAADRIGR